MNANELADKLDLINERQNIQIQAATMLRQQQLKIDNLYENNARLDSEINALKKEIKDKHTKSILRSLGHE